MSKDGTKRNQYGGICLEYNCVGANCQQTQECTRSQFGFANKAEEQGDFVNFDYLRENVENVKLKFQRTAVVYEIYIFYVPY